MGISTCTRSCSSSLRRRGANGGDAASPDDARNRHPRPSTRSLFPMTTRCAIRAKTASRSRVVRGRAIVAADAIGAARRTRPLGVLPVADDLSTSRRPHTPARGGSTSLAQVRFAHRRSSLLTRLPARVERLFATPKPDEALIAEVSALVAEHGGLDYARRRGEAYAQEAEDALVDLPPTPARAALADAIAYVMDRRS